MAPLSAGRGLPRSNLDPDDDIVSASAYGTEGTASGNWGTAMSTTSLRLPDSLHERARELAEKENISINQLVTLALAEKVSALMTEEYLGERARRGSKV